MKRPKSLTELWNLLNDANIGVGAYVVDKCAELARSPRHERDQDGLAEIEDTIDPAAISRRNFLEAAVGYSIILGTTTALGQSATALYNVATNAILGKRFEISSSNVAQLEEARRTSFSSFFAVESEDQRALCDVVKRLNRGLPMSVQELTFLTELSQSRCETDVKVYASQLLSTDYGRCGRNEDAVRVCKEHALADVSDPALRFSLGVQQANVSFIMTPRLLAKSPEAWAVNGPMDELERNFADELNAQTVFARGTALANMLRRFGPPFVHAVFFRRYSVSANPKLNMAERRELWDDQLEFYRNCLDPSVVGSLDVSRAIWNHFELLALQAHRFDDHDYRKKFIDFALGSEETPFHKQRLDQALADRANALDHSYVIFVLLLASLEITERSVSLPHHLRDQLNYFVENRHLIPNQTVRVALDCHRKRFSGSFTDEDALREYLVRNGAFDSYLLDVPF